MSSTTMASRPRPKSTKAVLLVGGPNRGQRFRPLSLSQPKVCPENVRVRPDELTSAAALRDCWPLHHRALPSRHSSRSGYTGGLSYWLFRGGHLPCLPKGLLQNVPHPKCQVPPRVRGSWDGWRAVSFPRCHPQGQPRQAIRPQRRCVLLLPARSDAATF
jgi:hypothetical protein